MKLKYAVLPAAVAMLFSAASMADSRGVVYFKGLIKAPTCTVNGGDRVSHVNLGEYEINQFPTQGTQLKGAETLKLELKDCTGFWADLSLTANERVGTDKIKLSENSAKGLVIVLKEMTDAAGTGANRDVNGAWSSEKIAADGTALFEYQPFLVRTNEYIEAGRIDAKVSYTIKYL